MSNAEDAIEEISSGPTVFISYRRTDTGDVAPDLSVRLREDLGSRNVFRDEDDIIAGQRWEDVLRQSMEASDAVVFLVGGAWTGARQDGTRRIDEVHDPVRNEVVEALEIADRSVPIPILIDIAEPPKALSADVQRLFDEHHFVRVSRDGLRASSSPDYQSVLVGVWQSLRQRVPRGVLIVGDRIAMVSLDALVHELKNGNHIDARDLSRFASGAYVVSARRSRQGAKKWPDVIVLIGDDEPSDDLRGRLAAIAAHPGIQAVTLVGVGAVAGAGLAQAVGMGVGSSTLSTASSSAQLLTSLPRAATGPVGTLSSAWAAAAVGVKVVAVAAAGVIVGGSAFGVITVIDDDRGPADAEFPDAAVLAPFSPEDVDAFPLDEPESVTVRFGPPESVSDEEARQYFGNFAGGSAERRSVQIDYSGSTLALDDILLPVSYPLEFIEQNTGTFRLTSVSSDGPVEFVEPGTGASSPCVYDGTDDTVGGWEYTGNPGDVSLELLFESDGASVTDIGIQVAFDGPAQIVVFQDIIDKVVPEDVNTTDNCTPILRTESRWSFGLDST